MKKLQQLCAAVVLTLVFALSAFAGEMGCPGVTSPPPDQPASATGDIQNPSASATGQMGTPLVSDPVVEIALTLMGSAFSVF